MNDLMVGHLKKWAKHPEMLPMRPAVRELIAYMGARARGKAEGKREALLTLLAARGLATTAAQRARIGACSKAETLDRWIRRAATATSVSAVLGPVPRRSRRK